jgi:hypothetical protein
VEQVGVTEAEVPAHVATDQAHPEEHRLADEEPTARTVLYGVLRHGGAEKTAHEAVEAEQQAWSSIAHLADRYGTVAQAARTEHITGLLEHAGLDSGTPARVTGPEAFEPITAILRRAESIGRQPARPTRQL